MEPELEIDLAFVEDMALTKADKDWIAQQHTIAHASRGFAQWLKEGASPL